MVTFTKIVIILRYRSPWAPDYINSETTEK